MNVTKYIPCSLYDIQGFQEWLDEMALQGLFLEQITHRKNQAVFREGKSKPVRYRLDPVGKSKERDLERETPYKQAGWSFVDYIPGWYYIFSCDNPEAPELYSDPQSLAASMDYIVQRNIRLTLLIALTPLVLILLCFLLLPNHFLLEIILWRSTRNSIRLALSFLVMLFISVCLILRTRQLLIIHRTLAQGLPLRSKKRWKSSRLSVLFWGIWFLIILFINLFPLALPAQRTQIYSLGETTASHPWPTLAQIEGLDGENFPEEGYLALNDSFFAPVQEYLEVSLPNRDLPRPGRYLIGAQYIQANSPATAKLLYRILRDDRYDYLKKCIQWNGPLVHISELTPFTLQDHPELDRLEVARFRRASQDGWAFAALAGNEILLVEYDGFAQPEDCLKLFLDAMDAPNP